MTQYEEIFETLNLFIEDRAFHYNDTKDIESLQEKKVAQCLKATVAMLYTSLEDSEQSAMIHDIHHMLCK